MIERNVGRSVEGRILTMYVGYGEGILQSLIRRSLAVNRCDLELRKFGGLFNVAILRCLTLKFLISLSPLHQAAQPPLLPARSNFAIPEHPSHALSGCMLIAQSTSRAAAVRWGYAKLAICGTRPAVA